VAERGKHIRQARFQVAEKVFRAIRLWHGGDMLTMPSSEGNGSGAANLGTRGWLEKLCTENGSREEQRVSRRALFAYN